MYTNHAVVRHENDLYILLKRTQSEEDCDVYELYKYAEPDRQIESAAHREYRISKVAKRRFAPYLYSTMLLLSWAITSGHLSISRSATIGVKRLEKWFAGFMQEYDDGIIDISTIAAP